VDAVAPGSPAASGAIQPGDVVTEINHYRVRSAAELTTRLYSQTPGSEVTLTLDRAGTVVTCNLELGDAAPGAPEREASP
jgi:putative serine protease PepD